MSELNTLRKPDASADDWVSALFDGELDAEASKQAVARLGKDARAVRSWAEYSLIGDAMRGCASGRGSDLDARIRAALAEEPTLLAPMPARPETHRPYYLAAAAAVAAIAWGVLSLSPRGDEPALPVALDNVPAGVAPASNDEAQPYLAAHQDYAYAVAGDAEMRFTQVSLAGGGR